MSKSSSVREVLSSRSKVGWKMAIVHVKHSRHFKLFPCEVSSTQMGSDTVTAGGIRCLEVPLRAGAALMRVSGLLEILLVNRLVPNESIPFDTPCLVSCLSPRAKNYEAWNCEVNLLCCVCGLEAGLYLDV